MPEAQRLHLGASHLEKLPEWTRPVFVDPSWFHLGEKGDPKHPAKNPIPEGATNVLPWRFQEGDQLPFDDEQFSFAFTEHFLEHLCLRDCFALLKEVLRVLQPGGVFRISVPDADLRPDPEPVGFPGPQHPWTYHQKHRMRWAHDHLEPVLLVMGFADVSPLRYYDIKGVQHQNITFVGSREKGLAGTVSAASRNASSYRAIHPDDQDIILRPRYILRPDSLIVDAFKSLELV